MGKKIHRKPIQNLKNVRIEPAKNNDSIKLDTVKECLETFQISQNTEVKSAKVSKPLKKSKKLAEIKRFRSIRKLEEFKQAPVGTIRTHLMNEAAMSMSSL